MGNPFISMIKIFYWIAEGDSSARLYFTDPQPGFQ